MIETPQNVCIDDGILMWSPVPYADGYNIHIDRSYIATVPGGLNNSWLVLDPDETNYKVSAYVKRHGQAAHTSKSSTAKGLFDPEGSLVVEDYFQDLAGWLPRYPYWSKVINDELQQYLPEALSINEEGLTITATKDEDTWTSGIVTGHVENSYTYGYFEADIMAPNLKGFWPAFWLLNTKYTGKRPEIDIMEMVGGQIHQSYHWWSPSGNSVSNQYRKTANDEQNLYGLLWERNRMTWYINRLPTFSVWGDTVSDQAMYPIINLAVGGSWPGDPDDFTQSAEMKIRSFKVWQ